LKSISRICHHHHHPRYHCLRCFNHPLRFLKNSLIHAIIPPPYLLFLLIHQNHPNYVAFLIVLHLLLHLLHLLLIQFLLLFLCPFLFDLSFSSFHIESASSSLIFPPLLPLLLIQVLLLVPSPKKQQYQQQLQDPLVIPKLHVLSWTRLCLVLSFSN